MLIITEKLNTEIKSLLFLQLLKGKGIFKFSNFNKFLKLPLTLGPYIKPGLNIIIKDSDNITSLHDTSIDLVFTSKSKLIL